MDKYTYKKPPFDWKLALMKVAVIIAKGLPIGLILSVCILQWCMYPMIKRIDNALSMLPDSAVVATDVFPDHSRIPDTFLNGVGYYRAEEVPDSLLDFTMVMHSTIDIDLTHAGWKEWSRVIKLYAGKVKAIRPNGKVWEGSVDGINYTGIE